MRLLLALLVVIVPFGQPAADYDTMTLEQQQAFIQAIRPGPSPIVLPVVASPPPVSPSSPTLDWRGLVTQHFHPEDVDRALRVIWCESRNDPWAANPTSSARGLFQHMGSFWEARSAAAGVPGANIFDIHAQFTVAAWLVYEGGGWSHWYPSKFCWQGATDD